MGTDDGLQDGGPDGEGYLRGRMSHTRPEVHLCHNGSGSCSTRDLLKFDDVWREFENGAYDLDLVVGVRS